ncbi:3636_t:CDS:2 [Funneliformis caledonium]|uniref:3636_t:CDS:1 n=1 Tax=Funneliformis caledonium TaxID=1117310 RepID=A0A9N8VE69_9GLOM|nr:3636_t:CDS:2 [Funneliformis caledonium]
MGKVVHRSYASKKKALERIKAKRRERQKEIKEPLSRHDKNDVMDEVGTAMKLYHIIYLTKRCDNGTTTAAPIAAKRVATAKITHQ